MSPEPTLRPAQGFPAIMGRPFTDDQKKELGEMMKNVVLSDLEKVALVHLLYALARVDGVGAEEERQCLNRIFNERGITTHLVEVGKLLSEKAAIKVVANMSREQKIVVGVHLEQIIDCDNDLNAEPPDEEIKLFNQFITATGIDLEFNGLPDLDTSQD